jgi:hypothetical protein
VCGHDERHRVVLPVLCNICDGTDNAVVIEWWGICGRLMSGSGLGLRMCEDVEAAGVAWIRRGD